MRKLLVVGVIGLFLGIAGAPSINANVSRDNELVEITTEICGMSGWKHTVQLTKEEAEEVDRLFENIRLQLNESTSREEAVEIFNDAVVELNKYGLLGGLSVKQVQKLVTGRTHNCGFINFFEKLISRSLPKSDANAFCLITGEATQIYSFRILINLREIMALILFWFPLSWIQVLQNLAFGASSFDAGYGTDYSPAKGWIYTFGINGVVTWEGEFFGIIPYSRSFENLKISWHFGAFIFTGLRIITNIFEIKSYIIGRAPIVLIESYSSG